MKKSSDVNLTDEDRKELERTPSKGTSLARIFKRVTALLELDKGQSYVASNSFDC